MNLLRAALDFLLPTSCAYCFSSVGDSLIPFFCSSCWNDFSLLHGPACPSCGRLFDSSEALAHSSGHRCLSCRNKPPAFDSAISVGHFEGPLREAVHLFKYRPCRSLGKPLGAWMVHNLQVKDFDFVIPVPLHRSRLHERGFNQSLLLADAISEAGGGKLCFDNLARIRPTRPQVELSGAERIKNVAGAFALARPREIAAKHILLVDDVFTTGATLDECAQVLRASGAAFVTVLTLARAD